MSTLIEIEQAIESLPSAEFRELHRWIAADAGAGKLDALGQRVRVDDEAGVASSLPIWNSPA